MHSVIRPIREALIPFIVSLTFYYTPQVTAICMPSIISAWKSIATVTSGAVLCGIFRGAHIFTLHPTTAKAWKRLQHICSRAAAASLFVSKLICFLKVFLPFFLSPTDIRHKVIIMLFHQRQRQFSCGVLFTKAAESDKHFRWIIFTFVEDSPCDHVVILCILVCGLPTP